MRPQHPDHRSPPQKNDDWSRPEFDLGNLVAQDAPPPLADLMSSYFDSAWYLDTYPDVAQASTSPEAHYLKRGWREGRSPNAYFDPVFYRRQIERPLPPSLSELQHYYSFGWIEGLNPSAEFDAVYYAETHPDVVAQPMEPLAHFLRYGSAEGRASRAITDDAKPAMTPGLRPSLLAEQHLKVLSPPTRDRSADSGGFDPRRLRLDWIIPDFAPGAGGHMAIFKAAYWLERLGHEVTIWLDYPNGRSDSVATYEDVLRYFLPLRGRIRLLESKDTIDTDVLIATDRWTVWSALQHGAHKMLAYFVQDYEPWFYPVGSEFFLTENTYRKQLFSICSSPWLEQKMSDFGSTTMGFVYPADSEFYHPPPHERGADHLPLIALYARPATGRRAVELALLSLVELANRGAEFQVAMFGEDLDENSRWPFQVQLMGVLTQQELGALYRRADIGIALSATNYSICTVEMMACGLPIIDIQTESTSATYPPGAATLAQPDPHSLADAIARLLQDSDLRNRLGEAGRAWATRSAWPDIAADMAQALTKQLIDAGSSQRPAMPGPRRRQKRVTVAIPTLNAGPLFEQTLTAVEGQDAPWEVRILCVDSGSTDETLEILAKHPDVVVHQIPMHTFRHGATRNLAVEMSDSDYVAFLTQDAIPATTSWLSDLVSPLEAVPGAAGSFGRHLPHADSSVFVERDLNEHFDLFKYSSLIVNRDTDRRRFEARDPDWLGALRYFSNNNSCLSVAAWEHVPFPDVKFGEDQVWAWNAILAGYTKVYVDKAAVYHSHNYGPAETFRRARTESAFFRLTFGANPVVDENTSGPHLRRLMARDVGLAMRKHLPAAELKQQLTLNAARIAGFLKGNGDDDVQC